MIKSVFIYLAKIVLVKTNVQSQKFLLQKLTKPFVPDISSTKSRLMNGHGIASATPRRWQ